MFTDLDLAHIGDICCDLNTVEREQLLKACALSLETVRAHSEALDFLLSEIEDFNVEGAV